MASQNTLRNLVWRIPPLARKALFEARRHVDLPVVLPIGNGLLWIARGETYDFEALTWEVDERAAVSKIVKAGDVAIDVGAHCGLYTLLLSRLVGAGGRVLAFEPSPRELFHLRRHVRLNGCSNVRVEPSALGDANGNATLHLSGGFRTTGNNSLRPSPGHPEGVTVPLMRLDDYVSRHEEFARPDFIKMDIEGAELEALRGARKTIERSHPTILIEMSEATCIPWGYRCVEKYDLLSEWGYTMRDLRLSPAPRRDTFDPMVNLVALHPSRA